MKHSFLCDFISGWRGRGEERGMGGAGEGKIGIEQGDWAKSVQQSMARGGENSDFEKEKIVEKQETKGERDIFEGKNPESHPKEAGGSRRRCIISQEWQKKAFFDRLWRG